MSDEEFNRKSNVINNSGISQIRILMLDRIDQPAGNGWTTHKWELSRELSKNELEIHFLSLNQEELNKNRSNSSFVRQINYVRDFIKKINNNHFDMMYTRNIQICMLCLFTKRLHKSKILLEMNGLIHEHRKLEKELCIKKGFVKKIGEFILEHVELFVTKKADIVIAVTNEIKNILVTKGVDESKLFVISNGANIKLFRPFTDLEDVNKLRRMYDVSENDNIVMFVGNLAYWQGVEYLVQSAPYVLKTMPNTIFIIVGDGETKNELEIIAKKNGIYDKFIFIGNVTYEKVPLFMNMADVCVVPKKLLGFGYSPLKLYEYMACGKPVIATNTMGFEILKQHEAGILIDPSNSSEFSEGIISLLQNEQLRAQMGINGRKIVVNEYSWEITSEKTANVIREAMHH